MSAPADHRTQRYHAARRVTLVSVFANIALSIGKIAAGVLGRSSAMVADGVHSASDLVTDAAVLIGMRIASREPDEDHPYGHGKFETLVTQFIALSLLGVVVGIVADASGRLQQDTLPAPTGIALIAAIVSILTKEGLFQYTITVGRKWNAQALIANAWHHRSDAISSIAALGGIIGAMAGWPILDPIAAIAVGLILAKVAIDLLRDTVHEITDSTAAIDDAVRARIHEVVQTTPGIHSAHFVKARRMGSDILIDVHVVVDLFLSVSEGHQIADKLRMTLSDEIAEITDVLVHVDPVDDQHGITVPIMTSRRELAELVDRELDRFPTLAKLQDFTAHYTPQGIVLDLSLRPAADTELAPLRGDADALCAAVQTASTEVAKVRASVALTEHPIRDDCAQLLTNPDPTTNSN